MNNTLNNTLQMYSLFNTINYLRVPLRKKRPKAEADLGLLQHPRWSSL